MLAQVKEQVVVCWFLFLSLFPKKHQRIIIFVPEIVSLFEVKDDLVGNVSSAAAFQCKWCRSNAQTTSMLHGSRLAFSSLKFRSDHTHWVQINLRVFVQWVAGSFEQFWKTLFGQTDVRVAFPSHILETTHADTQTVFLRHCRWPWHTQPMQHDLVILLCHFRFRGCRSGQSPVPLSPRLKARS